MRFIIEIEDSANPFAIISHADDGLAIQRHWQDIVSKLLHALRQKIDHTYLSPVFPAMP